MNDLKDRLRARLKATGMTQTELSKQVGVSKATITFWLNGTNGLTAEKLMPLAKALRCSPQWLASGEGMPDQIDTGNVEDGPPIVSPFKAVKIVGTAQMGSEGYWCELEEGEGFVDVPSSDPKAYALRLRGDSMAPAIRSGWVAVIEPSRNLVPGEYVMIRLQDDESMLKELLYANDREVSVMSINDAYARRTIPTDQIEHIHYVGAIVPPSKVRV